VGVFGAPHPDVEYRAYLQTSLNARGFSSSGIRGGRQQGNRALAEDVAGSARVDWSPDTLPGALLGASAFVGNTGQNNAFDGEDVDALTTLWDLHAQYRFRGLELRGLAAFGAVGDAGALSRQL
jgi:hypothetical protein